MARTLFAGSAVLLGTGTFTLSEGVASATFGRTNGDVAWAAICNSTSGQQIFSSAPTGTGEVCPPGTPGYTTETAGRADSMPYFSASGALLYFSSGRAGSHNSIYYVTYPNTVSGSTDNAIQLTHTAVSDPATTYDYDPTVAADGSLLAWIRCTGASSGCNIFTASLTSGTLPIGTPTQLTTGGVAAPSNTTGSGDGNRPEINPQNSNQVTYVGTNGDIWLMTRDGSNVPGWSSNNVDLTANSSCPQACSSTAIGAGAGAEEHPDWSPDGTTLVFDSPLTTTFSNQGGSNLPFTMTNLFAGPNNVKVAPVWNTGQQAGAPSSGFYSYVQPVYAPATNGSTIPDYNSNPGAGGKPPTLAWVAISAGSNVQIENGNIGSGLVTDTTNNATNNGEVIWQPAGPATNLPESPITLALPLMGGAVLLGAGLITRRRNQRSA